MNHERLREIISIQAQLTKEFEFLLKVLEAEIKDIFKPTYHYPNVEIIYGLKKIIIKVRTAHSFTYNNITQIADILTSNELSINRLKSKSYEGESVTDFYVTFYCVRSD